MEKDILSRHTNERSCFDIQSPAVPKTAARLDVDEARSGVAVDGRAGENLSALHVVEGEARSDKDVVLERCER